MPQGFKTTNKTTNLSPSFLNLQVKRKGKVEDDFKRQVALKRVFFENMLNKINQFV